MAGRYDGSAGTMAGQTIDRSTSTNKFNHALWPHAWYCIRKCNIGIANLDKMTEATQEEKNLIAGQLYFFRAWWHFEMMEYFGGLPYITSVLPSDQTLTLPRLTYQQCADSAAIDFRHCRRLVAYQLG